MPNHCECDLSISGDPEIIENLLERYKGDSGLLLDANKIIPYPDKFKELDAAHQKAQDLYNKGEMSWEECRKYKDGFNSGGYEWCCENWGTKWGMYRFGDLLLKPRSALMSFQSAWAPPLPLIEKMGADFPDLTFTLNYYECGVGFQGKYKVKGGIAIVHSESVYRGSRGG